MTYIFDGRNFAKQMEKRLKFDVKNLSAKKIKPKLVSILVGSDPASKLYVNLKKITGNRIGCGVNVLVFKPSTPTKKIISEIKKLNIDNSIHGIMVQLPLPKRYTLEDRDRVINSIDPKKDVDGLGKNSRFVTPTAKSVYYALKEAQNIVRRNKIDKLQVAVVGSKGFEGRKIIKLLRKEKYNLIKISDDVNHNINKIKNADVLISVTGVPSLIKRYMIESDIILIDVGSPKGDIDKKAYEKASFVSPVPGGVGPITITCLLENLINASDIR